MDRDNRIKNYSVYCHTSPSNKKYVGISCNLEKRWNNGKGYIKNYLFYRAIEKYGWDNFKHEILYNQLTLEEAGKIEKQLIAEWNLTNPQFGYNLREGGNGNFSNESRRLMSISRLNNKNSVGRHLSLETRQKISESLKQYYKTHTPTMTNKKQSEETKEKLRNRKISDETKLKMKQNHADVSGEKNPSAKPIRQLDLNGNILEEFAYATLASRKFNLDLSSIIKCCRGKAKTCGGYKWEYI